MHAAPFSSALLGILVILGPAGCGGADDVPAVDTGTGLDVATPGEEPLDTQPTSATAYAISVALQPSGRADGGLVLPTTHQLSLLVDWTGNTITTGAGGTANQVSLVQAGGEWTNEAPLTFSLALAPDGQANPPALSYDRIAIHPTAEGCAGQATGRYLGRSSDILFDIAFEAELTGVIDRTGPVLTVFPRGQTELHPMDLQGIAADELLPAGTTTRWVTSAGTAVPMVSVQATGAHGASGFVPKGRVLAFASSYQLDAVPAAVDLAGNPTAALPVLATLVGPGLLTQDGFEGPVDALLGGQVKVVDGTSAPVPAGNHAVRFAPIPWGTPTDWTCDDRFTARLAVAPGATTVRFTALSFRSRANGPFMGWLRLGVPNGAVTDLGPYWIPSSGTALPRPVSIDAGAGPSAEGDLRQIELPLPEKTSNEVIFDLYRPCTEPLLRGDGLLIDDLRVE